MNASLHVFAPEVCLASELIEHLCQLDKDSLAQTLLILPTQRLGTYILAGILRHHVALKPPSIMTLERFIRQHGGDQDLASIPDSGLELLLRQLIERGAYQHIKAGHERELRLLHHELYEHACRQTGLHNLQRVLAEDIYKSDAHIGTLHARAEEIAKILYQLDQELANKKLGTRAMQLAAAAQNIEENLVKILDGSPTTIIFAAYTSIAPSWRPAVLSLLRRSACSFWLHEAPKLFHNTSPLKELLAWIGQEIGPFKPRKPSQAKKINQKPLAFKVNSPSDEVRWALGLAKLWIAEGISPHSIAILVSKESYYAATLKQQIQSLGIPYNIALAENFGSALPGRLLRLILNYWRQEESSSSILALLDHPSMKNWLTQQLNLSQSGFEPLAKTREALLRTNIPGGLQLLAQAIDPESAAVLRTLQARLGPLHPHHKAMPEVWRQHLIDFVCDLDFWNLNEERDILQSAQDLFQSFLQSLQLLDATDMQPISGSVFWEIVDRHLLAGNIRGTGEPLAGIQILSIPEARTMPFHRAIIIGCQEGFFPQALPRDELLDNYLKKAMGLPGWEALEAMEDQTFHLLEARLPLLILLRAHSHVGEPIVRSRFTEAMVIRDASEEHSLPLWSKVFPSESASPLLAEASLEGQFPGDPENLWSSMSASRLEKLLRCPYAFLLDRLQVRELRPTPWAGDSRREGEWLHAVLEVFVSGKTRDRYIVEPWPSSTLPADFRRIALDRLATITRLLAPPDLAESAIIHHLLRHSWPQFISHLEKLGVHKNQSLSLSLREIAFGEGTDKLASVAIGGRNRLLLGRIDALDEAEGMILITDFKRRRCPSIEATQTGLAPQLAFYSLALADHNLKLSAKTILLGYWNIYQGSWQAHAISEKNGPSALSKDFSSSRTPTLADIKAGLIENWSWRESSIREQNRFFADPSSCEMCSYDGICRKEDPRFRLRIQEQNAWENRKKIHSSLAQEDAHAAE